MISKSHTLLQTKLFIPPTRPRLVPRSRLIEQLNKGLHRKLTLISAPAGFGKTTLVTEWLDILRPDAKKENQIENGIAWLSLDEGDNDPARFLTYFIAALNQIEGIDTTFGKGALSMLQSPQPPPNETVLTTLINEIAAIFDRIILVLDDYHLIEAQPIHDVLAFLMEHLPQQMHLVIATREDPHLPLARVRSQDQLTELRASDLRFTSSEAAEFLNQVMGLDLSEEDIAALETRTEGWIAGLQLAAISLQGKEDTTKLIKSFSGSHRLVLDYLIEEVLDQQPESVKAFLLQTAILDRLTGSLCDALTGQEKGKTTLELLDRANLFIVPLDEGRQWYRFHHLFGDLLRERIYQTNPQKIPLLHSRASKWFEQQRLFDEAIEHALQSDDFDQAARIIDEHIEDRWQQGKLTRLSRWLDKLPEECVYINPNLCLFLAWSLFISGDQEKAEETLQAAEHSLDLRTGSFIAEPLEEHEPPSRLLENKVRGRTAAIRAVMATYRSDAEGSMQSAQQALDLLPEDDFWRSAAATALADAYVFMGEYDKAHQARLESLRITKKAGNIYLYLVDSAKCVLGLKARGELLKARDFCQQQLLLAKEKGFSKTGTVGWIQAILGEILAEANDLDAAYEMVNEGLKLTERGRDVALLSWSYMCLTRVLYSRGDLTGAENIFKKTAEMAQEATLLPWVNNQMTNWQVRLFLSQGKQDRAINLLKERDAETELEESYVGNMMLIPHIRIQISQGLHDKAYQEILPLLEAAEAGGYAVRAIELLILQALNFQARNEIDKAITALTRALTLAKPGGFIRIFVDEGPPMSRLVQEALNRGVAPEYVQRLLAAFSADEQTQAETTTSQVDQSKLIEPLSERELEVLQRIAEGLTNREIADRLYLSLNTVKVHTRNIYGKLGVNNRTQAVARARDLDILPST